MAERSEDLAQAGRPEIGRPRLLDRVHEAIRRRFYSRRTEEAYVHWIKRFIFFNGNTRRANRNARMSLLTTDRQY